MPNTTVLIENQAKIFQLVKKYGFFEAIFFKGFDSAEKHNLNIHLKDTHSLSNEPSPQTLRRAKFKQELQALLNCNIVLSVDEEIDSYCLKKLNNTNSVSFTGQEDVRNDLINVFGEHWEFNPPGDVPNLWQSTFSGSIFSHRETQPSPAETENLTANFDDLILQIAKN